MTTLEDVQGDVLACTLEHRPALGPTCRLDELCLQYMASLTDDKAVLLHLDGTLYVSQRISEPMRLARHLKAMGKHDSVLHVGTEMYYILVYQHHQHVHAAL